jgi:hypothetical protein
MSVVLYRSAKQTQFESAGFKRYRRTSAIAPFLGLIWLVVVLVLHATISNEIAHQSVGYSPDPYVTLPNGYVVGSANTYDGYVHAPGAATDVPWIGPGYVRGIVDLSYSDGRFAGTYLDARSNFNPQGTDQIRSFIFDTRDRSIKTFASQERADFEQQQNRVHEDATSYWYLYARYRHHWPTTVFWLLLLSGEAAIVILVVRRRPKTSANDMPNV